MTDETDDQDPQEELFPSGVMDGGKTTLKTLVKPGQGHKTRVALSRAENLRIEYVEHVPDSDEGLIEQRFKAMMEVDSGAAGRLVERLQALMTEQLSLA